jgi:phosphoglycerate dehydrogenase-like enzyme
MITADPHLSAVERKYYNRISQQVSRAVARLEAEGFFRNEPKKRKFGGFKKRTGTK